MASTSNAEDNEKVVGKYSDIDEYGFMRGKDFNYKSYENFFSEYAAVLAHRASRWNKLLKNGEKKKVKADSTVKRFCRKGIPMRYRSMVWMNVSGAQKKLERNPEIYKQLIIESYERLPGDQELLAAIKTDIDRTFPDNIHYRGSSGTKRISLDRVLTAIGRYKKDIGYCQGMNYVAALLLLVIEDEESVFWLFVSLLEDILPEYYSSSMLGLRTDMEVLDTLVKERIPAVASCLQRESVSWVLLASKWFICLYADVLPTETVLRIWDCLFVEGSKILFRVALSLITLKAERVEEAEDMPALVEVFRDINKEDAVLECHAFMQSCFKEKVPLRMANIKKLRIIKGEKLREEEGKRTEKRKK